ncbi:MAG: hypothetical protein CL589_18885 [Alteromonadaceae bacterium]|nr:hypothetical protein [Alteromonadaceae bacterium]|tara:strand:+ start:3662 stop:4624 length:963 start_codon:yes stop_codon:yes gene_type:complete
MKLVSFSDGGEFVAGVLLDGYVLSVSMLDKGLKINSPLPKDIKALFAEDRISELATYISTIQSSEAVRAELIEKQVLIPANGVKLGAPIPSPALIVSSGGAYKDHLEEMAVESHKDPLGFIKNSGAICGPGDDILLPEMAPDMVDWEGEFTCVISKPCYNVSREDALDYIGGYTLINDVSARDGVVDFLTATNEPALDIYGKGSLMVLGKQFPTFCPVGPCIVTSDELDDPGNVELITKVNGVVMQNANTRNLIHDVASTVAYFSQYYQFQPGDLITTGTPAGIGFAQKPPVFLKEGDTVEVSSPQIGALINQVRNHQPV